MDDSESDQEVIFKPLKRSNRGRKSTIRDENFLMLVQMHHREIIKHGKMLEINHPIIADFADKLGATKKCIHLKLAKYVNSTIFGGFRTMSETTSSAIENTEEKTEKPTPWNSKTYDETIITSLQVAARTAPYSDYIKKLSIYPSFNIQYHSELQYECYRKYLKTEWSCVHIQSTTGLFSQSKGKKIPQDICCFIFIV